MNKFFFIICYFFFILFYANSLDTFTEGKQFFSNDEVENALPLFEEAIITNPSEDAYKYLGESYSILGQFDDAVLVLEEALTTSPKDISYFKFKLGNAYYASGDFESAYNSYNEVIKLGGIYVAEANINGANVAVELKYYSDAIGKYTKYLELAPQTPQKRKIIKMIFLLKKAKKEKVKSIADAKNKENLKATQKGRTQEISDSGNKNQSALNKNPKKKTGTTPTKNQGTTKILGNTNKTKTSGSVETANNLEEKNDLTSTGNSLNSEELEALGNAQPPEDSLTPEELKALGNDQPPEDSLTPEELEALGNSQDSEGTITSEELQGPINNQTSGETEGFSREDQLREEALMNDILKSLDTVGENAKGVNAKTEGAFNKLEGSKIDE